MTGCLAEVSALIRREAGVELPAHRHGALRAALHRVAPGLDPCDFVRAATGEPGGRDLVDQLIDEVTIQESSFLRDSEQLDAIDWRCLRAASPAAGTSTSGQVRVWSSGCARGEEAYTLALLAAEAFAPEPAPVSVLGTDISGSAIAAAAAGRYGSRAVRAVSAAARERYFEQQAGRTYLVGERLRAMVRFARHNLARDPFPPSGESAFDVIVCRNVLIYLSPPLAEQVIGGLERSLRPGGALLLGAADALLRSARAPRAQAGQPSPPGAPLRRPLGRPESVSREDRLAAALEAANRGLGQQAHAQVAALLAQDPMDAEVQFVLGLITLEAGDPAAAAAALRRCLYADARFALAAFTLGRAYDALGDAQAARRSYRQALRDLDPDDQRHDALLKHVDIGDIAAACRARLAGGQP